MEALGTAVGVISLGLQLCTSVTNYIDGLKCARYEVASIARQLECLGSALEILETGLQKVGPIDEAAQRGVHRCVSSVEAEMKELSKFLDEVKRQDPGDSFRAWMKEQKKKACYPFSRANLQKLEARLTAVNSVLFTAIQAMNMCVFKFEKPRKVIPSFVNQDHRHIETQRSLNASLSLAAIEAQLTQIARAMGDSQGQSVRNTHPNLEVWLKHLVHNYRGMCRTTYL